MLFCQLPNEIQQYIHDCVGEKEENMKKFSKVVEPLIITQKYLFDLKQKQLELPVLSNFEFRHTTTYRGNFDVLLEGKWIMNVHVDRDKIKCGDYNIMRYYDYEWTDLDQFIQFIVYHYIEGQPFPRSDWIIHDLYDYPMYYMDYPI